MPSFVWITRQGSFAAAVAAVLPGDLPDRDQQDSTDFGNLTLPLYLALYSQSLNVNIKYALLSHRWMQAGLVSGPPSVDVYLEWQWPGKLHVHDY